jgi:pectate lyase
MKRTKLALILLLLTGSASSATNRPDGYETICKVGQRCAVAANSRVAFGASGKFTYKVLSGSFACNVDTFGTDPNPKKSVKECSVSKSDSSNVLSSDVPSTNVPQAPSVSLTATGGDGKIDLAWDVTGAIATVQVMRDTDANPKGRKRVAFLAGNARGFTDHNVVNGTKYWYWIKYTYANRVVSNSDAGTATPMAVNTDPTPTPTPIPPPGTNAERLSCAAANTVQGFASIGGSTNGGAGGSSVTVTNGADMVAVLKKKRKDTTPLTIYVDGTLTPGNSGGAKQYDIKDMENVSIIGVGKHALLDGIGINIVRAKNVIVRNLTIRYNLIGQKDGISIQGNSNHIWIDHNEVYNSLDVDKDYYDELVSGKDEIDNVTVSYNYLHDSWKTSLWGSSDGNAYERRVTFLGNHWKNVNSRLPLFRFGQAHVANNYYEDVRQNGINSRMGARIRIEGNYFENANNPIISFYSKTQGYWDTADNIFKSVTWKEDTSSGIIAGPNVGSTISYKPAYGYSLVPTSDVKQYVLNNAGVGKLDGCL